MNLPPRTLGVAVGMLVFLAIASMFLARAWTGYLTGVIALAGVVLLLVRREFDRTDGQVLLILALLPGAYLANMLIHGFGSSIFGRPARLLIAFFAYYAIRRVRPSPLAFFDGCAAGAIFAGAIAVYQVYVLGLERASSVWNAVPFGNYSVLLGFLVLCALACNAVQGSARPALYVLAVGMSVVALVLSETRGSWLAVPVLLVLVSLGWRGIGLKHRMGALGVALAGVLVLAAVSDGLQQRVRLAAEQTEAFLESPHLPRTHDTSVGLRLAMWKWGLDRFAERPLVGIGLVHYDDHRRAAVESGELDDEFLGMANVHNQLIHFLAVGGVLMAAMLVLFWVVALRFFALHLRQASLDDAGRAAALAGLCVVVGTGLFSMTGGLFGTSPDSWAFAALLCMTLGLTAGRKDARLHV